MPIVQYARSSPYADTPQFSWRIGGFVNRPIPASKDDERLFIEPRYHLRPDLLSHYLYQTPAYYWVFMVRNIDVIRDPIFDFTSGKLIIVPTLKHLASIGL